MSRSLTTESLAEGALPQALPLLRATWPVIELEAWREFAADFRRNTLADPALTVMRDEFGGICGLFASRLEQCLCGGRMLMIPLFTVVDIGNSLELIENLLEAADAMAREHGCVRLAIHIGSEQRALLNRLRSLNLERSGISLSSPIAIRGSDLPMTRP